MKRFAFLTIAVFSLPVHGLSPQAQEFISITRQLETVQCEKRLAQLQPRVSKSPDAEDPDTISRQRVEAFYRCE